MEDTPAPSAAPETLPIRPMGQFDLGRAISRGASAYGRRFVSYTLLSALIYLPLFAWLALVLEGLVAVTTGSTLVVTLLTALLGQLVTVVLLHATVEAMRGRPGRIGPSLRAVLPRIPAAIGVAILSALIITVGFLALIIPGLIVMTKLWVAIPATVVERTDVTDSLGRSWNLVTGHGWAVFGVILLLWLPANLPELVMRRMMEDDQISLAAYLIVPAVIGVVMAAIGAAITAAGYYELRVAKEGIDLDDLASAFD